MVPTPHEDDWMRTMDGENYLFPYYHAKAGKTSQDEELEEYLRVEGLEQNTDGIYPNFLDYWMFWS